MKEFRTVPTQIGIFLARAPVAQRSKSVKGLFSGPTEVPIYNVRRVFKGG